MILPIVLLCSNACVLWFVWRFHQQTQQRVAAAQRVHQGVINQLQDVVAEIERLRHEVQNQSSADAVDHEADWWKSA
jgi:hypothetical protein